MATVYFIKRDCPIEQLYQSFMTIDEATELARELNDEAFSLNDDENICLYNVYPHDYTREEFNRYIQKQFMLSKFEDLRMY